MTAQELSKLFSDHYNQYGTSYSFPSPYYVSAQTYSNVLQYILQDLAMLDIDIRSAVPLFVGHNGRLLFKGIELIIREK